MVKSATGFLKKVSTLWQRNRPQSVMFGCWGILKCMYFSTTFNNRKRKNYLTSTKIGSDKTYLGAQPGMVRGENSRVWPGYFSSYSLARKSLSTAHSRACLSRRPPKLSKTRMLGCFTGISPAVSSGSQSLSSSSWSSWESSDRDLETDRDGDLDGDRLRSSCVRVSKSRMTIILVRADLILVTVVAGVRPGLALLPRPTLVLYLHRLYVRVFHVHHIVPSCVCAMQFRVGDCVNTINETLIIVITVVMF